jgi:hypothetical protein
MAGEDRFGQSWSTDKRMLTHRMPSLEDFASVIRGHFRNQIGDHLEPTDGVTASDLLDRISAQAVGLFDDAWENGARQSRLQQTRVKRRRGGQATHDSDGDGRAREPGDE